MALLLYKLSRDRGDRSILSRANLWIKRTVRNITKPGAFYNPAPDWDLTEKSVGRMSLHFHESGVRFVEALIALELGNRRACHEAVARFLKTSRIHELRHELFHGKGGMLLGCALLLDAMPDSETKLREQVRARGEQIYREVAALPNRRTPKAPPEYLGIAHGQAGILYTLLVWHDISGRAIPPKLSAALKKLAQTGQEIRSAARWSVARGSHHYWSGWCNGTAGYVFLWTLTARLLSHPGYLELAAMAAEHTWKIRSPNPSLCCGAAGDGYAYLNLYRATGEKVWLQRARKAAEAAMKVNGDSLFQGRAGVVALLSDLDHPETSWMPMFERPASRP